MRQDQKYVDTINHNKDLYIKLIDDFMTLIWHLVKKGINLSEMKSMSECYPVDMWAFAEDIEKEMKKHYGLNKKTRETIK